MIVYEIMPFEGADTAFQSEMETSNIICCFDFDVPEKLLLLGGEFDFVKYESGFAGDI
jgi:hypothetical protein